jgi:hypothetical protein
VAADAFVEVQDHCDLGTDLHGASRRAASREACAPFGGSERM